METAKTAEDILNEKGPEILSVEPDTTIHDALGFMTEKRVGAVLVKEGDVFLGIWTERDLMKNTIAEDFNPKMAHVRDYMTRELVSAAHDESIYGLMDKFLGLRLRHLLIERDGQFIGLLSSGDVIRAALQETSDQVKELDAIVHLKYYEEWRWNRRKKR